jgi:isocitrate lyase
MSYLNKKVTRQRILDKIKATRPHWDVTRVSEAVLIRLDARIDEILDRACHQHPPVGKTFKDIIF